MLQREGEKHDLIHLVLAKPKLVVIVFLLLAVASIFMSQLVKVNFNILDYLPEDSESTVAINVMQDEFTQGIPNARAMVPDMSIAEALAMKAQLEAIEGVKSVTWLDDAVDITEPLETLDPETVQAYYKDGNVLFTLTVDSELAKTAMPQVREVVGEDAPMSGMQVETTFASDTLMADIQKILGIAIPIVFLILILTTTSWFEPLLFLITIGLAILINLGTNLFFGEISFITKGVAAILQLAVSMDYAIFILHRFAEFRRAGLEVKPAMEQAVRKSFASVTSSGITTIVGFSALILMRIKIGPDVGWVMTKGIIISLISVFTLLPALTLCCYKLLDKTAHRSFVPDMKYFAKVVGKLCVPCLIVFAVCVLPSYLSINKNDFVYFDIFTDARSDIGREAIAINDEFGRSTNMVLLVEKGDMPREKALVDQINALPHVTSTISYVGTVGAAVPTEYLPDQLLDQLISAHYSRIVISMDVYMESPEALSAVETLRQLAQEAYPNAYQLAGEACNVHDMKTIVETDTLRITTIAIVAVLVILIFAFKSWTIPLILVLVIESSIWINCGIPYFTGEPLYYIAYLVIGSMQLGATVDYAILYTSRYFENRETMLKHEAMESTSRTASISIFTSGGILIVAGLALANLSSNALLCQLGILISRGALLSLLAVLFVLPALLMLFDRLIQKTSKGIHFINTPQKTPQKGTSCDETDKQKILTDGGGDRRSGRASHSRSSSR